MKLLKALTEGDIPFTAVVLFCCVAALNIAVSLFTLAAIATEYLK